MNQYRMFFVQTSTLLSPSTHQKQPTPDQKLFWVPGYLQLLKHYWDGEYWSGQTTCRHKKSIEESKMHCEGNLLKGQASQYHWLILSFIRIWRRMVISQTSPSLVSRPVCMLFMTRTKTFATSVSHDKWVDSYPLDYYSLHQCERMSTRMLLGLLELR